ncbi:cupin domain-containing protein [soil metagenome]
MEKQNVTPFFLAKNGAFPNNPNLPLLLYRQVLSGSDYPEKEFKEAFRKNDWGGTWVNGVFAYHHYHSTAHEALGVLAGTATLIFGGPGGKEIAVRAGDMVVLPAGTAHCRKKSSSDFKVIGAYPKGQEEYDLCTEDDDPDDKKENIRRTALPTADPLAGIDGPLGQQWKPQ